MDHPTGAPIDHKRRTQPEIPHPATIVLKPGNGVRMHSPYRVQIPPRRSAANRMVERRLGVGVGLDEQKPPRTTGQHIGRARRADQPLGRSAASRAPVCTGCCPRTCAGGVAGERPETTVPSRGGAVEERAE